ncbi:MAG: cell division protein PerM, partial [Nocardioidaceae bacterium]
MVDLLSRTASRPSSDGSDVAPAPSWLAGIVAGVVMAAAGVIAAMGLAVLGWLGGGGGSVTGALRVGADAWLLGHGSGLRIDGGTIEAIPLGLTFVVGWLSLRAGRWAARTAEATRPVDAATVAATYAAAYSVGVLGVALLASQPGAEPLLVRALAVSAVLAAGSAGIGAASQLDDQATLRERVPEEARAVWIGALSGALTLLAGGALALVVSLLFHLSALRALLVALDPGLLGGLLLILVSLAVLPNVVLFSVAVLLGPGLSIGTGTSVTLSEVSAGPMPAIPWLAAVPNPGTQPAALSALAAIPLLCGV